MSAATDDTAEVWAALAALAESDGVQPGELDRCWDRKLDEQWRVVLNTGNEPRVHDGIEVPSFGLYVEFNGFPAGILQPWGGVIAAGSAANAQTLSEALRKAAA